MPATADDLPDVRPLEDCLPQEVWPQETSPFEVYRACLFHGTHKCRMVEVPARGLFARGTILQPVSWFCSPSCGSIWLAYRRGTGPECHCLERDTPEPPTT